MTRTQGYHRPLWRKTKNWVWTRLGVHIWTPSQAQIQLEKRKKIWTRAQFFAQSHSNKNVNFGSSFCALLRYTWCREYLSNADNNPSLDLGPKKTQTRLEFFVFLFFEVLARLLVMLKVGWWWLQEPKVGLRPKKDLSPSSFFFTFLFKLLGDLLLALRVVWQWLQKPELGLGSFLDSSSSSRFFFPFVFWVPC